MQKLKIRKIFIIIAMAFLIINLALYIFNVFLAKEYFNGTRDYTKNIWEKQNPNLSGVIWDEQKLNSRMYTTYIWFGVMFLFMIFALAYAFNKNNSSIALRKWPHVVLIIISTISLLATLWLISKRGLYFSMQVEDNNGSYSSLNEILKEKAKKDYSFIGYYQLIQIIWSSIISTLSITQLVLIKMDKNSLDINHSEI